jgi:hypothetical protein
MTSFSHLTRTGSERKGKKISITGAGRERERERGKVGGRKRERTSDLTEEGEVIADAVDSRVPFIGLVLGLGTVLILVLFAEVDDLHLELAGVAQPAPAVHEAADRIRRHQLNQHPQR